MSELPREVSRSTLMIGDIAIEVVQLDNGQRLVTEEGMATFMRALTGESDGPIDNPAGSADLPLHGQ